MGVGGQCHGPATLPWERTSTHCIGGWVWPRASLDGWGKPRPPPPTAIRSPDCPDPSESLYRLSYPGPKRVQGLVNGIMCGV